MLVLVWLFKLKYFLVDNYNKFTKTMNLLRVFGVFIFNTITFNA